MARALSGRSWINESIPVLDETPPVLTLHEGFNGDVEHKVAVGESVTIPKAIATDEHLKGEADVLVYYGYGTEKQILINTQGDTFTPSKVGRYTLVYSAWDTFGNQTQEVVHISCGKVDGNVAAKLTATNTMAEAGAWVGIPACTVSGLYEDDTLVKVYAQFEDEKEAIENYSYFPKHVGTYQLVYELETPFATYTTTSELTASAAGNSQIGEYFLPQYFIKGYSYTLDDVDSYSYTKKDPVCAPAKTLISQDGGDYIEIDHKDFKITASSTVQFKFTCGEEEVETQKVKVIDVGVGSSLQVQKYFYDPSGKFTASATKTDVRYTLENGVGDYAFDFINVLSLSALNLEFTVPAQDKDTLQNYNEMDAVEIVVTDYYDRENQVVVRYENNGGTLNLSINGGKRTTITRSFTGTKSTFAYSNGAFLDTTSSTEFAWKDSFTSDKVLLGVRLIGVEGGAGIAIARVGKQGLNEKTTNDAIAPTVYVANLQNGIKELGSIATLEAAQVTDVLSPYLEKKLGLAVTDPDGNFVTSVDGELLDGSCDVTVTHEIKLEKHGDYIVMYSYTDQSGNNMPIRYAINVPERIKPTITLKSAQPYEIVEASLNTKVRISEAEYSDDTTPTEQLRSYVYVSSPDYTTVTIGEDRYFNATKAGDYTVMYCCYDGEGNFTIVTYTVRVS